MKSIRIITPLLLGTLLALGSCSKESVEPAEKEKETKPASSFFSAKIDAQAFPAVDIQFTSAKFVVSTKMLQITGQPADRKETINLSLMPFGGKVATAADWKPGTYDFDPAQLSKMGYLASAEYNKWNGNGYDQWFNAWDHVKTGNITIVSNSGTHIKGTFSFDAVKKNSDGSYNTGSIRKISEGSFDLDIK